MHFQEFYKIYFGIRKVIMGNVTNRDEKQVNIAIYNKILRIFYDCFKNMTHLK